MKLMKSGIYKASNVSFNPMLTQAWSYDWWCFVKLIDGKVVFNDYKYSPTTQRHQRKVRSLMNDLGIDIDLVVAIKEGLQTVSSYDSLVIEELKKGLSL